MADYNYGFLMQFMNTVINSTQTVNPTFYSGNVMFVNATTDITITLESVSEHTMSKLKFIRTGSTVGTVTINNVDNTNIIVRDADNGILEATSLVSPSGVAGKMASLELMSDGTNWIGTDICFGWTEGV